MKIRSLVLLLVSFFATVGLYAATIIGNLDSYVYANASSDVDSRGSRAVGFVIGDVACTITDIELRLIFEQSSTAIPSVEIWSVNTSDNKRPVSVVGTFTLSETTTVVRNGSSATYLFEATSSVVLLPNTTYYLIPRADTELGYKWLYGNPDVIPTGEGAVATTGLYGSVPPSSWSIQNNATSRYNWFRVSGTLSQVPEVSTMAAQVGVGALAMAFVSRFLRNRQNRLNRKHIALS